MSQRDVHWILLVADIPPEVLISKRIENMDDEEPE